MSFSLTDQIRGFFRHPTRAQAVSGETRGSAFTTLAFVLTGAMVGMGVGAAYVNAQADSTRLAHIRTEAEADGARRLVYVGAAGETPVLEIAPVGDARVIETRLLVDDWARFAEQSRDPWINARLNSAAIAAMEQTPGCFYTSKGHPVLYGSCWEQAQQLPPVDSAPLKNAAAAGALLAGAGAVVHRLLRRGMTP